MFRILIITAGMIASLYGATVISIIGTGGIFNFFYLVLGIVLIAIGAFWKTGKSK